MARWVPVLPRRAGVPPTLGGHSRAPTGIRREESRVTLPVRERQVRLLADSRATEPRARLAQASSRAEFVLRLSRTVSAVQHPSRAMEALVGLLVEEMVAFAQVTVFSGIRQITTGMVHESRVTTPGRPGRRHPDAGGRRRWSATASSSSCCCRAATSAATSSTSWSPRPTSPRRSTHSAPSPWCCCPWWPAAAPSARWPWPAPRATASTRTPSASSRTSPSGCPWRSTPTWWSRRAATSPRCCARR